MFFKLISIKSTVAIKLNEYLLILSLIEFNNATLQVTRVLKSLYNRCTLYYVTKIQYVYNEYYSWLFAKYIYINIIYLIYPIMSSFPRCVFICIGIRVIRPNSIFTCIIYKYSKLTSGLHRYTPYVALLVYRPFSITFYIIKLGYLLYVKRETVRTQCDDTNLC